MAHVGQKIRFLLCRRFGLFFGFFAFSLTSFNRFCHLIKCGGDDKSQCQSNENRNQTHTTDDLNIPFDTLHKLGTDFILYRFNVEFNIFNIFGDFGTQTI